MLIKTAKFEIKFHESKKIGVNYLLGFGYLCVSPKFCDEAYYLYGNQ